MSAPAPEAWSWSILDRGNTVTVYERRPGGPIYVRVPHPDMAGGYLRRSLGHRDRRRAKKYAKEQAAGLQEGAERIREGRVTLHELSGLYRRHRIPRKGELRRGADLRRLEMWERLLGPERDPLTISLREWETFQRDRSRGLVDAWGRDVPEGEARPVKASTVNADLRLLRAAFSWAAAWRDRSSGRHLLRENPVRGFPYLPSSRPRRPVATADRFEAIMATAPRVEGRFRRGDRSTHEPTYLPELLALAAFTGRRIGQVLQLRAEDLRLDRTPAAPFGAVRWPAETEKTRKEATVPLHPEARRAIDRQRARVSPIGRAYLFPAPSDPSRPLPKPTADRWLRKAEDLAGLRALEGGRWHPYRRKWATERKHLPTPDIMQAGGWDSAQVFERAYLMDDPATVLRVVLEGGQLREIDSGPEGDEPDPPEPAGGP